MELDAMAPIVHISLVYKDIHGTRCYSSYSSYQFQSTRAYMEIDAIIALVHISFSLQGHTSNSMLKLL